MGRKKIFQDLAVKYGLSVHDIKNICLSQFRFFNASVRQWNCVDEFEFHMTGFGRFKKRPNAKPLPYSKEFMNRMRDYGDEARQFSYLPELTPEEKVEDPDDFYFYDDEDDED